jgi:hypothetical protein
MASQPIHVLPVAKRSGTIQSNPESWPTGVQSALFQVVSTTFTDPATSLELILEESRDGGATWLFMAGSGVVVGGQTFKGQPLVPAMNVELDPNELDIVRQVRGTINIVGTVRFGLDITINS